MHCIIFVTTFEFAGALSVTSAEGGLWHPELCRKALIVMFNFAGIILDLMKLKRRWSIICFLQMTSKGTLERNLGAEKAEKEKARCLRRRILGVKIELLEIQTNI